MTTFHGAKILVPVVGFLGFIAIDLVWLGLVMRDFYIERLSSIFRLENGLFAPNWMPALIAWWMLVLGIYIFVLPRSASFLTIGFYAGLYGFLTYGIYNFTNHATLIHWPIEVVFADTVWGTAICAFVGILMKFVQKFT